MSGQNTYTEAFNFLKDQINDGLDYGEMQIEFLNILSVWIIEEKIADIARNRQEVDHEDDCLENSLYFLPVEAVKSMKLKSSFRNVKEAQVYIKSFYICVFLIYIVFNLIGLQLLFYTLTYCKKISEQRNVFFSTIIYILWIIKTLFFNFNMVAER